MNLLYIMKLNKKLFVNKGKKKLIRTLKGHTSAVFCLVVLPNGQLASGSFDKTIKIWDTNTGKEIRTLKGHTNSVYCLVVLPNGQLASGSRDQTIKIWDTNTGF